MWININKKIKTIFIYKPKAFQEHSFLFTFCIVLSFLVKELIFFYSPYRRENISPFLLFFHYFYTSSEKYYSLMFLFALFSRFWWKNILKMLLIPKKNSYYKKPKNHMKIYHGRFKRKLFYSLSTLLSHFR